MTEEPKTETPEEDQTEEPKNEPKESEKQEEEEGDTPQTKSPIDEAKEVLKNITEQNKVMADNLKKAEKISADQLLGGHSLAGGEKSEEDKKNTAARNMIAGSGFEDDLFPQ